MHSQRPPDKRRVHLDQPAPAQWRILRTVCLYFSFLSLGLQLLFGPTLIDLEHELDTDTKNLSAYFIINALGFMVGSFLCGVIFDRINQDIQLALASSLAVIMTAVCLWTGSLIGYLVVFGGVHGMAVGFMHAGGQAYLLTLWTGHKHKEPLMQGLLFVWSVGATVAPFVVQPFLAASLKPPDQWYDLVLDYLKDKFDKPNGSNLTLTGDARLSGVTFANQYQFYDNTSDIVTLPTNHTSSIETNVKFAYVAVGVACLPTALFHFLVFCVARPSLRPIVSTRVQTIGENKESKCFRASIIVFLFLFMFVCFGMEMTVGKLIATFVVKGLKWDKYKGTLATSMFYGVFGFARLVGIPLSAIFSPRNMIISDLILMVVSSVLLSFAVHLHQAVGWTSIGVLGFAIGPVFATAVLWASRYILVTGTATSVFLIGSSLGSMSIPALAGFLFEELGHMCIPYVTLGCALAVFLIFIIMQLIAIKQGEIYSPAKEPQPATKDANVVEMKPLRLQVDHIKSVIERPKEPSENDKMI